MKVKEAIEILSKLKPDYDLVVFGAGEIYPALEINQYDDAREVEVAGGWTPQSSL
jgi:hypothetical protein